MMDTWTHVYRKTDKTETDRKTKWGREREQKRKEGCKIMGKSISLDTETNEVGSGQMSVRQQRKAS